MRLFRALAVIAVAVSVCLSSIAAHAGDDELKLLEAESVRESEMVDTLDYSLDDLTNDDELTSLSGDVTLVSRASNNIRMAKARRLDQSIDYATSLLASEGWKLDEFAELTVIEVELRKGKPSIVWGSDGNAVIIRRLPSKPVAGLPELKERPSGPPTERDAVHVVEEARLAMWNLARTHGGGGALDPTAELAARFSLQAAGALKGLPSWMQDALLMWLTEAVRRGPPRKRGHVCGGESRAPDEVVARVFGKKPGRTAEDVRVLSDVIGSYSSEKDLAPALGKLREALADAEEGFDLLAACDEALGASMLELFTAALADESVEADCEAGRLPCPGCRGKGKLEIACPSCEGTSKVVCASCSGSDHCIWCRGEGKHFWRHGGTSKCQYCKGRGRISCKACKGKEATACGVCRRGEVERDCVLCEDGSIACPWQEKGAEEASASLGCSWCKEETKTACNGCRGSGYLGCGSCHGTGKRICVSCLGAGETIMVYTDGTIASSTKCDRCDGKGGTSCHKCEKGRRNCATCDGEGERLQKRSECQVCDGTQLVPAGDVALVRIADRRAPATSEEAAKIRAMKEEAIKFVLTCRRNSRSSFALREFRDDGRGRAGELMDPSLFANAKVLWVLTTAGIDPDDRRVAGSWAVLRNQIDEVLGAKPELQPVQAASLGLRALAIAGQKSDEKRIKALINAIVKGQVSGGGWNSTLDGDGDVDEFDSLFALESLWLASRSGYKVPSSVWSKGARAAKKAFSGNSVKGMKKDFVIATQVASNTAMIIMAKSAQLGDDAAGFDYESLPQVAAGLEWLDRYFSIENEPSFNAGGVRVNSSDAGYSAYLFAIQRLAMLLSIEVLGGERWHRTGARHLATLQFSDGSFEETSSSQLNGPVRTTTSVLLFLLRATPSVTQDHRDR